MAITVINLQDCKPLEAQGFQRINIFNPQSVDNNEISLEYVTLPKGAESSPHAHIGTHTVVYTLKGGVRIYFGDNLENQVEVKPQGCVYIPPNVIHHVVNEHEEEMVAIVARTPASHQVKEYTHLLENIETIIH